MSLLRLFARLSIIILVLGLGLTACNPTAGNQASAVPADLLGKPQLLLAGHTDLVTAIAVTPDRSKVISGSRDLTIKVWDLAGGHLLNSLEGHTDGISSLAVTPNGQQIISGS